MAFSTGCGTPLSNFEAGLNYKDVQDPSIMVISKIEKFCQDLSLKLGEISSS